jgi:hypothetical protein
LHLDVWIDARGLLVELKAGDPNNSADLHFSAWGTPVSITAPPANEVMAFDPSLLGPSGIPSGYPTDMPSMPTFSLSYPSGMPTTCVPSSQLMGPGNVPSGAPTEICIPIAALPPQTLPSSTHG